MESSLFKKVGQTETKHEINKFNIHENDSHKICSVRKQFNQISGIVLLCLMSLLKMEQKAKHRLKPFRNENLMMKCIQT